MSKLKDQIEFLYLQTESLDELTFQGLSHKVRERQIRVIICSAAMIMVRTSGPSVNYGSIEHCGVLIDKIVATLYPKIADAINTAYQIKKMVNKQGEEATQLQLEQLVKNTVEDSHKALLGIFALPENFPTSVYTGKGGAA